MANELGHMFSTDRPISNREEDQLDRRRFAESMATAIGNWREEDSLVVGLYGPWGCGKSSVINMTVDALGDRKDQGPLIVRFNPWQVSGQGEIVAAFFQEIRSVLPKADDASSRFLQTFDKYAGYFTIAAHAATLAASTGAIGFDPATSAIATESVNLITRIWRVFKKPPETPRTRRESLSALKESLKGHMKDLERPILVVIDDIDRLTVDEIRLVFRLVKANADFPNMVYLLALQSDVVAKALGEFDADRINGEEYMAKVIQVPFNIPAIDRSKLEGILLPGLDSAIGSERLSLPEFDKGRWSHLFSKGLSPFFQSLRDVKRFLSMLEFHIGLFRDGNVLEVNPTDLIALEVLRIFEPNVYKQLFAEKNILLKAPDETFGVSPEKVKGRLRRLIENASKDRRESVEQIIGDLFPVTQSSLSDATWGSDSRGSWLRDLRVCHERFFESYFQMNISEIKFSQSELERLLAISHDVDALETEFGELYTKGTLQQAIQSIEVNLDRIEPDAIVPITQALFAIGEVVCEDDGVQSGRFSFAFIWELSFLAEQILRQISDEGERRVALVTAINTSNHLYVPSILLNRETLRRTESDHGERLFDKDEDLSALTDAWVTQVSSKAEQNRLCDSEGLEFILGCWKDWGSLADAKRWTEQAIETENCVLALLRGFLHSKTITDSRGPKTRYYMRLEEIEDFVAIDLLKPKVDAIDFESLSENHRIAVKTWFEAVRRRDDDDHYDAWCRGDYPR